jgi:hypothetical protein
MILLDNVQIVTSITASFLNVCVPLKDHLDCYLYVLLVKVNFAEMSHDSICNTGTTKC